MCTLRCTMNNTSAPLIAVCKVYPDDFGQVCVRVSNKHGAAVMESWLGEFPAGQVSCDWWRRVT